MFATLILVPVAALAGDAIVIGSDAVSAHVSKPVNRTVLARLRERWVIRAAIPSDHRATVDPLDSRAAADPLGAGAVVRGVTWLQVEFARPAALRAEFELADE